ncbi:hypothetical protein DENSPDRAFT_584593 [Dentipellis sp. KUC8613]|nr:hypothetical protein DENSPDRAFT_584593 [Dentipellis sp. KUC8613]
MDEIECPGEVYACVCRAEWTAAGRWQRRVEIRDSRSGLVSQASSILIFFFSRDSQARGGGCCCCCCHCPPPYFEEDNIQNFFAFASKGQGGCSTDGSGKEGKEGNLKGKGVLEGRRLLRCMRVCGRGGLCEMRAGAAASRPLRPNLHMQSTVAVHRFQSAVQSQSPPVASQPVSRPRWANTQPPVASRLNEGDSGRRDVSRTSPASRPPLLASQPAPTTRQPAAQN